MTFLSEVTDQLNMRWAWEKVRRAATPGDVWFDEIELAGFELELEKNLYQIANEIRRGKFYLNPIAPLAFPKNPDKNNVPKVRQYFQLSVRDQVAWTAVVNVIGPYVDQLMPTWSYGNRLYRTIWVEADDDGVNRRKIGRYRHAAGNIYLPFRQGWPIFRRHVYLSIRAMARSDAPGELEVEDQQELELQQTLRSEKRCPFVFREYWAAKNPTKKLGPIYWCSVDLKKFYPSLRLDVIRQNLVGSLPVSYQKDAEVLLQSMLRFPLDTEGWSSSSLAELGLNHRARTFAHVPTGLYVAGFLANAALLKVDQRVSALLEDREIAHFRYVDDHIILSYSFDDLVEWIETYKEILKAEKTGAIINPDKVEPEPLSNYLKVARRRNTTHEKYRTLAERACELDPKFPSPLMTKTLALVSSIAQTDLNLLDDSELSSLKDQLEHLLLVDLSPTEIPEKTRLSFAASRLALLTERQLSNDEKTVSLVREQDAIRLSLSLLATEDPIRAKLLSNLDRLQVQMQERQTDIEKDTRRTFQLILKVLRERPDRVRLWTRVVQLCRLTGVKGLGEILQEIFNFRLSANNDLATNYLIANTLCLVGSQAIVAANCICDDHSAEWRKIAAQKFLEDVATTKLLLPATDLQTKQLRISWEQYCLGLYCADLILRSNNLRGQLRVIGFPEEIVSVGKSKLSEKDQFHQTTYWAWWAARPSLRRLETRADDYIKALAENLTQSTATLAFWRYFPEDVPDLWLLELAEQGGSRSSVTRWEGWWYESLRSRPSLFISKNATNQNNAVRRVRRNLQLTSNQEWVSLYDWVDGVTKLASLDVNDPRVSEWSALEIVRQIAEIASLSPDLNQQYLVQSKLPVKHDRCLHPANFRVPRQWLDIQGVVTWESWKKKICDGIGVQLVPIPIRLNDQRYSPLSRSWSTLFSEVNQVRGLGLLLYGILKRHFSLPTFWNGAGHADVLSLLPSLLLKDITCSSNTLGLLLSCLQPRVTENLLKKRIGDHDYVDDDSLVDPIALINPSEVVRVISFCQLVLENNQLSSLGHRARQLTPISIKLLTQPDWYKAFEIDRPIEDVDE